MRSRVSHRAFNAVVVAFLLDIFELPSPLYVYDASPCQWNFLEGHLEWYDILLIYALFIRGDIPPQHAFPIFLFVTYSRDSELNTLITIYSSSAKA